MDRSDPAGILRHADHLIPPVYSNDECLVNLPAGVTAVKMTWNPAVETAQHHSLNAWGYIPSTAVVGSRFVDVGAFNAPYNVATVFPGNPNLNNYTNIRPGHDGVRHDPGLHLRAAGVQHQRPARRDAHPRRERCDHQDDPGHDGTARSAGHLQHQR